jgi:hypothetical protein
MTLEAPPLTRSMPQVVVLPAPRTARPLAHLAFNAVFAITFLLGTFWVWNGLAGFLVRDGGDVGTALGTLALGFGVYALLSVPSGDRS